MNKQCPACAIQCRNTPWVAECILKSCIYTKANAVTTSDNTNQELSWGSYKNQNHKVMVFKLPMHCSKEVGMEIIHLDFLYASVILLFST